MVCFTFLLLFICVLCVLGEERLGVKGVERNCEPENGMG
jgi:hypothetical protein